jgi:hypothetical protein
VSCIICGAGRSRRCAGRRREVAYTCGGKDQWIKHLKAHAQRV